MPTSFRLTAVISSKKYPLVVLLFVGAVLMTSCYPRISPTGPVVASAEDFLSSAPPSSIDYSGLERRTELPVLPFRLWGIDFAEEMLFELAGHPLYAMVEICHIRKRAGEWTWFALVAEHDGRQHVAVATEDDFRLGQSFPAPVYRSGLQAQRTEQDGRVEYRFSLTLPDGGEMEGSISSRASGKPPPATQRNGSAMNHSEETTLAVIDLKKFNWARPEVRIDGKKASVRMLAPLVPYAMRLEQAAGGMAAGQITTSATAEPGRYELRYGSAVVDEPMELVASWEEEVLTVSSSDQLIDFHYRFRAPQGSAGPLELVSASVGHGEVRVFDVSFEPPIPDLRYGLEHAASGLMVGGVNGKEGYMAGSYRVEPGDEVQLFLLPDRPFWACERPLQNRFQLSRDEVLLRAEVVPSLALDGAGAELCFARRR